MCISVGGESTDVLLLLEKREKNRVSALHVAVCSTPTNLSQPPSDQCIWGEKWKGDIILINNFNFIINSRVTVHVYLPQLSARVAKADLM